MVRNLYLAIIILFVIGFLYIIKEARHNITIGLIYLVILTITIGVLTGFVFIADYTISSDILSQYNLTPKSVKILLYTLLIITYITIIQIPVKKLYNKDIELIAPPPGEKGKRGNRGKQGDAGYCTKCGTGGDMCYKKILYNITLTYNWWRKNIKKIPLLPDSYIIKNEYLKSKIKNHCSSDEFSKILKKFGSNNKKCPKDMESCGAYDYMFRMWSIWILIILKYDKGKMFLESEQLTETDFVNMIDEDVEINYIPANPDKTDWNAMFLGDGTDVSMFSGDGTDVSIYKVLNDKGEFELEQTGLEEDFFKDKGVPMLDGKLQTPFHEIKKYSAWYWGSKSNSKPIVEIRTGFDNKDSNVELCKTCSNGCKEFKWDHDNPKIKIKKTNAFYTLFSTDKAGQDKEGTTYTPFQLFGSKNVTFLRPYDYLDNEEHPKFRNYKPVGDILINSSELNNKNSGTCEPNDLKYTRENKKKIVNEGISSILVSGDVVHPIGFGDENGNQGTPVYTSINRKGINKNITAFTVWKPILSKTDKHNYVALGYVIDTTPYKEGENPTQPSTDIMVCVPKDMARSIYLGSISYNPIWNSGTKKLDGSTNGTDIELVNVISDGKYRLNTFREKGDDVNLAIKSNTDLVCTEYDMYNDDVNVSDQEIKNECTINEGDKSNCEANPKCVYNDTGGKCNYKSTDITKLINYSILKIYK